MLAIAAASGSGQAQQPIREAVLAASDGSLKISVTAGTVRVVGWTKDSIVVSGTLGPGVYPLELASRRGEAGIRAVASPNAPDTGRVDLEIRVPRGTHLAIRTVDAAIFASGLRGTLDAETQSGDIHASGTLRSVYAESVGGDIELEVSTKIVRATTVEGDVTLRGARGYVEVSTVSGRSTVTGRGVWEGEITSVAGDIRFDGSFEPGATYNFATHGGTVELRLPFDISADFEITALKGRVENSFAPAKERSFSTGEGGTRINVKSFKGAVRIESTGEDSS